MSQPLISYPCRNMPSGACLWGLQAGWAVPVSRSRNLESQLPQEHAWQGASHPLQEQSPQWNGQVSGAPVREPRRAPCRSAGIEPSLFSPSFPGCAGVCGSAMPSGSFVEGICIFFFFSFLSLNLSSSCFSDHGRFEASQTGVNIDRRGLTAQQGM